MTFNLRHLSVHPFGLGTTSSSHLSPDLGLCFSRTKEWSLLLLRYLLCPQVLSEMDASLEAAGLKDKETLILRKRPA